MKKKEDNEKIMKLENEKNLIEKENIILKEESLEIKSKIKTIELKEKENKKMRMKK